jgi:hypothetical protein
MASGALACAGCEPVDEQAHASADADTASEGTSFADQDAAVAEPSADPEEVIWQRPDAGAADAAREDAAPAIAPPVDICGPVPTSGRCRSEQEIELCVVTTGLSEERIETHACPSDQRCVESAGRARCVLRSECRAGTTRCAEGALETCAGDHWESQACVTECVATPLGAFCASPLPMEKLTGRVQYERRLPNAELGDWSAPSVTPARGFLLLSYHGDELLDAVLTNDSEGDDAGTFSLRVRSSASVDDSLVLMAAGTDATQELTHAVADPGFAPSLRAREPGRDDAKAAIWSYRFALSDAKAGGDLTVREEHGSAACHVFDRLRQVYLLASQHYRPQEPEAVLVWLGLGTQWSCHACSAWSPVEAFATKFEHQVWLDGSRDQGYWSDAVTAHELGHYVMNAYGFPLGEGGPHYLGVPTQPGQAYSEGWATFFSSLARGDSLYFDKQGGAFFWWDLDRRAYSLLTTLWARALPWLGLLQRMDENEAAAIMWQSYQEIGATAPVLDAIASERLRVAPFARGYKRRIWTNAAYPDVFDTTEQPLPCLADYLDALRCSDAIDADTLSQIIEPRSYFPYPSESPLCR